MRVDLFDYELPAELIAQEARPRGRSRLLVLDRSTGSVAHRAFADLPEILGPENLLVRNDVRVRHARLYGRDPEGRWVELLLLSALGPERVGWAALARPGRRAKKGRSIRFPEGLSALVTDVREDGRREVAFDRAIDDSLLERIGNVPLPPYIRREPGRPDRPEDREAYQTVFARDPIAVAAPTAGLHFTPEILARIDERGCRIADLTLAVGAGTFKPVTAKDTKEHVLDPEEVFLPERTRALIREAPRSSRRVIAVGTTVVRALEAADRLQGIPASGALRFATDLFITPGFEFRVVNALLTNFHLPRSTLLMLTCAFGGRENVLAAYEEAIREGYLFYSYGDAMLVQ